MRKKIRDAASAARPGLWIPALLLLLPGCVDVKNVLSFPREGPDEFTVVAGQPLLLPPDFTLRPPAARSAGGAEPDRAREAAQEAIFSEGSSEASSDLTTGEEALLERFGSSRALQEAAGTGDGDGEALVVDPEAEAERLRANQEAGAAPTEGATPTRPEPGKSIFSDFWNFY